MIAIEHLSEIVKDLVHPDPSRRRAAAEELADGDERALYPLIKTLRDEAPGVQDAARRAIIAIGGETAAYMTLPLLREAAYLRNTAVIILREIGRPAVPLLRPLLGDKDDDVRKFALDLLADIRQCDYGDDIMPLLEADPNANVRASAAKTLGVLRYRKALPDLIAALHDDEWVTFSALEAIGSLADASAAESVAALLTRESDTVRLAAIETLGKIADSHSSRVLLEHLEHSTGAEKSAVIKSLVEIGVTPSMAGVLPVLRELWKNGDWEERLVVLRGMVDLREEQEIPAIIDTAGSLDPSDPASEDLLDAVKQALLSFGCTEALIRVLDDPATRFRGKALAAELIGELDCREAMPSLIRMLAERKTPLVLAAIGAVARMAGPDLTAILAPLKDHGDETVRERVSQLLERS